MAKRNSAIPDFIDIPGYEGLYKVTDSGQVINRYGKAMKPVRRGGAYWLTLSNKGKTKNITMTNILKLTYFVGEKRPLWHRNLISYDFSIRNIMPMTRADYSKWRACSHRKCVVRFKYRPDNEVKFYRSIREAGEDSEFDRSSISNWCNGKYSNRVSKYTYMYEEDYLSLMERLKRHGGVDSYMPPEITKRIGAHSMLTVEQWMWARDRHYEGYTLVYLSKILGVGQSTIRSYFNVHGWKKPPLPPLSFNDVPK